MYRNVLVPLDGSKLAEAVLPHVEELALRCQARVILLRVVEPELIFPELGIPYPTATQDFQEGTSLAEMYLGGVQDRLAEKGVKADIYIAHGPAVDGIISAAKNKNADLVAMASHGRTGLKRVFYGSVASGVLNRIKLPLLIVRSFGGRRVDDDSD